MIRGEMCRTIGEGRSFEERRSLPNEIGGNGRERSHHICLLLGREKRRGKGGEKFGRKTIIVCWTKKKE